MMKLKLSLSHSVSLALSIFFLFTLSSGCTLSTQPTYLKESIPEAVEDICRKEYKLEVSSRLVGRTLWIYLPLEDIFTKPEKPQKYTEKFEISKNEESYKSGLFKFDYAIKAIPEQEKVQEVEYKKDAKEKIGSVWKVLRRVIFSMEKGQEMSPELFCLVIADIKNGIMLKEVFYYLDLKKVSYEYISWGEYSHRTIQDMELAPNIIGDKRGSSLEYRDITLEEFVASQIRHRIGLKFQKPEVSYDADIDKEIIKIIINTIKIYGVRDFSAVELNNLLNNSKVTLNREAIWAEPVN
ncbi:MAG: hypothetical protein ABIG46_06570 [Candidatus Omnitrophota bacterium]|nr:hypothetical protein [Candidatus Omnitrophota bacterium]